MDKEQARRQGLIRRRNISEESRKRRSHEIFLQLLPFLKSAEKIGCYVSLYDEVSTEEILLWCFANNKEVYVPKVEGKTLAFYRISSMNELEEGTFHVREPVTDKRISPGLLDLMVVPVVAFDEEGNRCGFGKGYYDSVLNECENNIGIAFKEQKINHIDYEEYDVKLNMVIAG